MYKDHQHRYPPAACQSLRAFGLIALLALLPVTAALVSSRRSVHAEGSDTPRVAPSFSAAPAAPSLPSRQALKGGTKIEDSWHDSLGDGFPDSARLEIRNDRETFLRWFTFLAESQYYAPSAQAREEIQDCAALIRFAYRNALAAHSPAWREAAGLPFDPGFGDVAKFNYPRGPLGRSLFRITPGPAESHDLEQGAFAEFADSATLLRYNAFPVSRELRAAQAGDLLFFHQATQHEPFHTMLFVGRSYYQPRGTDWIVYHTGDLEGHRGEVRAVRAETLLRHPNQYWRPVASNPSFLGIYRLEILR